MNGCICEKLCRVLCWNNFRTCPSSLRSIQEGATCVSVSANRDASARSLLPEGTRLLSFSKQPAEQARAEECVYEREGEREKERGGERNRRKFSLRCTATMCPPSENIQKRRTDKLSARRPTFEGQRETSRRYTVNTGSDDDVEPALLQEPVTPRFFLFSPSACFDLLVP